MDVLQDFFGLAGKVAIVTGGGSGIGKASAIALAGAGAEVVVADIDAGAAEQVASQIRAEGFKAAAVAADIGDEAAIVALFQTVQASHGRLDILVNCAADYSKRNFLETSGESWDRLHRVTLRGTFLCMREGVKAMIAAGNGGRVVNVSSIASLHPSVYDNGCYGAAKAGVNALTRAAALEFAEHGINVNAILPGPVFTEGPQKLMAAGKMEDVKGPAASPARYIMKRLGKPEEIAAAILFLSSPGASYVTGQSWAVDGGFLVS